MKWHDAKKELPEDDVVVFLYGKWRDGNLHMTIGWRDSENDLWRNHNDDELLWGNSDRITHWCYLKDIPKPKDNDE